MPCGWKYSSQRLGTPARTLLVLLQQKMGKKKATHPTLDQAHDRLSPSNGLKQP